MGQRAAGQVEEEARVGTAGAAHFSAHVDEAAEEYYNGPMCRIQHRDA